MTTRLTGDPEEEARNKHMRDYKRGLHETSKAEATTLPLRSLGDAISSSLGATDIKRSSGNEKLIRDISMKNAFERAHALGLSKADAERRISAASDKIEAALIECESPIERRLLAALVFANYGPKFFTFLATLHLPKHDMVPPLGDLIVIPQFAFIRYRMDFAVIARTETESAIFGIECDGKEFHKDADKGRIRDAYLKGFGIDMTYFSGSEIHADPSAIAQQFADIVAHWRNARGS